MGSICSDPEAVAVGDVVHVVDEQKRGRLALVNRVMGPGHDRNTKPSLNVVMVHLDEDHNDSYGRQIERETSLPHQSDQSAPGCYWRCLG